MSEGPYNYRGARWFVDSIVTDVEARLSALEKVVTTSAPTLGEQQWPSDRDAAIQACALMVLGICKTEPQEVWPKRIEGRIRYLLSKLQPQAAEPLIHWRDKPQNIALLAVERGDPVDCDGTFACPICGKDEPHQHSSEEIAKFRTTQPQAAEPKGCPRCKSSTAAGCNDIGCGYLDSAEPKGLTEEQLCAVQCAEEALRAIAERGYQIGDTIEPINDIRAASSRAAAALKRFAPVARALLEKGE